MEILLKWVAVAFSLHCCLALAGLADATISPGEKSKSTPKSVSAYRGARSKSVFDLELVEKEPLAKDIIKHSGAYYQDTSLRHFNGTVLGYVTPWNADGYSIAKTFLPKFDIVAPVWLTLNKLNGQEYQIDGIKDMNVDWFQEMRRNGKNVKVLPRLIPDRMNSRDFSQLMSSEKERQRLNRLIVKICNRYDFDGIVLEIWSALVGRVNEEYLYTLIIDMANALKDAKKQFILVIPPHRQNAQVVFNERHFDQLHSHVDYFSLNTYDYSTYDRPGANAPLHWMRESVKHIIPDHAYNVQTKRPKILMGLNMYGYDFTPDGGSAIVKGQYLQLIANVKKRLSYSERDVESYCEIRTNSGRHFVFYPTLHSINERIKLAQELGTGLALWELGQGLDYFYDLL